MFTFGFMRNENVPTASGPQESYPVGDGTGVWSVIAGTGSLYQQIDELVADDDTTYIGSAKVTAEQEQDITLQSLENPSDHTLTKINLRHKRRGSTGSTQNFKVYVDGVLLGSKNLENDTDWHDWEILLSTAESQALNWGADLTVTLRASASTYTRGVYLTQLNITTEQ